jgi:hypothetical protein
VCGAKGSRSGQRVEINQRKYDMAGARRMAPVEGLNRPLLRVGVGAVGGVNVRELEMRYGFGRAQRVVLRNLLCPVRELCLIQCLIGLFNVLSVSSYSAVPPLSQHHECHVQGCPV